MTGYSWLNCWMSALISVVVAFIHPANICLYVDQEKLEDVILGALASQITILTIVYSAVYSGADQRKHQSSTSLAFERGISRWPVNSPHKWPVTRKIFPFDDVIMDHGNFSYLSWLGLLQRRPCVEQYNVCTECRKPRKVQFPRRLSTIAFGMLILGRHRTISKTNIKSMS